ncbi:hypothetical protein N7492_003745 [Penicillium capsulatum]|uniref:SWIM-type domain-containing protein n=1 Tax=Penicillium capsulatum TaxID=69766 RepID=A0A9W9LWV7_9EURO|nr:hypothetical protein N7492_003745 [Penicillium capsulatum]KAJ6121673.1 hypothetical protein N7512_004138 [Penicillium capsulatum]
MSPPTRQFHRLSIGQDMQEPRAQSTRTARMGRPDPSGDDGNREEEDESSSAERESESGGDSDDEDDDSSDDDESTSASTVLARSGITYDLSSLDAESEAKALVGLTGQFDVLNCRASSAGYDFQLLDRPRVHISAEAPTCTCSTFQGRPENACQHIFWVLDQLHGYFLSKPPSREVALSRDGRPRVHLRIEDLLQGKLETVADGLNWQYLRVEGDGRTTGMTRTEKVRDVLSAFSTEVLPEDFRQDLAETTTQTRAAEQCVVQGDLEATIFRLAVHDDAVFGSLCKAMPAGACAAIYFDKMHEQTRRLLVDFDRYCATGESPVDANSPGAESVGIEQVVERLRLSVARIHANILTRAPHGTEGAAKALVSILESVASRNRDALGGNNWNRASFHNEDEDQRNLHHLLIGSDDMNLGPEDDLFVLSALEALPSSDLIQFIPKLREAQAKIEVSRAPRMYLLRLGRLVRGAETAVGSGQKRPAAGNSGGNSKRSR